MLYFDNFLFFPPNFQNKTHVMLFSVKSPSYTTTMVDPNLTQVAYSSNEPNIQTTERPNKTEAQRDNGNWAFLKDRKSLEAL